MKNLLLILFAFIALNACEKDEKTQNQASIAESNEASFKNETSATNRSKTELIKKSENPDSLKAQVRHFFMANGGSIIYLKNGDIKGQARFDTDGDFLLELMKTKTYGKYQEFQNYLLIDGHKEQFFDEFGRIISWKIIKGIPIKYDAEVITFDSPRKPLAKNSETVIDTRLIIFQPEYKTFKDENSEEAENYFIVMDDWNFYSHEVSEHFEKLGIKTKHLNKDILKLKVDNEELVINTKAPINGAKVQALLYKKGKRPLIISLIYSDNEQWEIDNYLKN